MLQWLRTNPCNFVSVLNGSEPRKNYKDLYGVTGAWKGQYFIPKLQKDTDFWKVNILYHVLSENLTKSHNFKNVVFLWRHTLVLYWFDRLQMGLFTQLLPFSRLARRLLTICKKSWQRTSYSGHVRKQVPNFNNSLTRQMFFEKRLFVNNNIFVTPSGLVDNILIQNDIWILQIRPWLSPGWGVGGGGTPIKSG